MSDESTQHMQCMEVWGGSQLTARRGNGRAGRLGLQQTLRPGPARRRRLLRVELRHRPHQPPVAGGCVGARKLVAGTAADLRTLMRRFVNRLDQTEFVRLLNQQFTAMSQQGLSQRRSSPRFRAQPASDCLQCGPSAAVSVPRGAAAMEFSRQQKRDDHPHARNIPLGLFESEYEQFDVELESGDCLLSYTDALIESRDATARCWARMACCDPAPIGGRGAAEADRDAAAGNCGAPSGESLRRRRDGDAGARERPKAAIFVQREAGAHMRFLGSLIRAINPKRRTAAVPYLVLANVGGAIIPALGRRWRANQHKPRSSP